MRKVLLSSLLLLVQNVLYAQADKMVINEIMVANVDYVIDPSFNYSSWIELYNPTASAIVCDELYVTDDPVELKKARVKNWNTSFARQGYFTIWFDHHDGIFAKNNIDFKLAYEGGTIYVTDGTRVLCSQEYPKAVGRVSYARRTNGGSTWAWTANPTPGKSNSTSAFVDSAEKQLAAPVFSVDGCIFKNEFDVNVTSPDGATIYYTCSNETYDDSGSNNGGWGGGWGWPWGGWGETSVCNNSVPTPTKSNGKVISGGKFHVGTKTVVIRARAFKDGYLPSEVSTRTYIYKDKNYVFPIISVSTARNNICGSEYGIMTRGSGNGRPGNGQNSNCNWNMDWDRPVNFEYITADGEYALNQEVDISTCGGWSRAWTPHSFKLKAGKYYMGKNTMDYPFFSEKPNIKHKTLQIRNGGNDNNCRIKDAAVQQVVRTSGLRINTQSWQPTHVFINGEYIAVLNMREPNNKHYAYSNYGYDTDELDQFEISPDSCYVQKAGTDEKFLEWYTLSQTAADEESYAQICDLVDIEEYINYMAVEFYICTGDWARNNVKGFRSRNDGKFHFVLFDTDSTGESDNPFAGFKAKKNHTGDALFGIYGVTPWNTNDKVVCENKFVSIFLNMLKNEDFRRKFVDSYCIIAGSVFTPARVKSIINDMVVYMNKGLQLDGKSSTESANYIINKLNAEHQTSMITQLKAFTDVNLRNATLLTIRAKSNVEEAEIFANGIKVPTGAMDGRMVKPVILSTAAPAGYRFEGWYNSVTNAFVSSDIEMEVTQSAIRYLAKWTKLTDEEMIAEGLNPAPVVINEVSAANDIYVNELFKKADWIELYNTSDQEVNLAGMYLTDNAEKPQKYQIPADDVTLNTILPAHSHKIVWCDKKESNGENLHADFKLEADAGYVAIARYDGDVLLYVDSIRYGAHDAYQSVGRYPDGGAFGYLMPKPTPGMKNMCGTDVMPFIQAQPVVTDIESVKAEEHADITIAYVGQGILNIKNCRGDAIGRVSICSVSGAVVEEVLERGNFATLNVSHLPSGTYIVRTSGSALKFIK